MIIIADYEILSEFTGVYIKREYGRQQALHYVRENIPGTRLGRGGLGTRHFPAVLGQLWGLEETTPTNIILTSIWQCQIEIAESAFHS